MSSDEDLPAIEPIPNEGFSHIQQDIREKMTIKQLLFVEAFIRNMGDRSATAVELDVSRDTVNRWLKMDKVKDEILDALEALRQETRLNATWVVSRLMREADGGVKSSERTSALKELARIMNLADKESGLGKNDPKDTKVSITINSERKKDGSYGPRDDSKSDSN